MIKLLANKNLFPNAPNIFQTQLLNLKGSTHSKKLSAHNLALLDALIDHPFWSKQSTATENIHALLMTLPEESSAAVRIATIEFWRNHFENLYITRDSFFITLIKSGIPFNTPTIFNPTLMHTLFRGEKNIVLTPEQQSIIYESLQKALYLLAPVCDLRANGVFPNLNLLFSNNQAEACRLAYTILPVQQAYSFIGNTELSLEQLQTHLEAFEEWIALHLEYKKHLLVSLPEKKLQNWMANVRVTANNLISLYNLINEPIYQSHQQRIRAQIPKLLTDDSLSEDIKQSEEFQQITRHRISDIINEFRANNSWGDITNSQYQDLLHLWEVIDYKNTSEQPSVEEFLATLIFNNYTNCKEINAANITHILGIVGGQTENKRCYTCLTWILDIEDENTQQTLIQYVKNRFPSLDHSEILLTKGEEENSFAINPNYQRMYRALVKIYNQPVYVGIPLLETDGLHDLAQRNQQAFLKSLNEMSKESRLSALLERDTHDHTPISYLLMRNKGLIPYVIHNIFETPASSDINILRAYYLQLCDLYIRFIDLLANNLTSDASNSEEYNQQKKAVVLSAKQILEDPQKSLEEFRDAINTCDNEEKVILKREKGHTIESIFGFFDIPLSSAEGPRGTELSFFQSTIEEVLLEQTEKSENQQIPVHHKL